MGTTLFLSGLSLYDYKYSSQHTGKKKWRKLNKSTLWRNMTNTDLHIAPKHCRLWGRRNSRTQTTKNKTNPKNNHPKTSVQWDWFPCSLLTAQGNWHYPEKVTELTSQRKLFSLLLHWLQWNPEQMSYMRIICQCKQN